MQALGAESLHVIGAAERDQRRHGAVVAQVRDIIVHVSGVEPVHQGRALGQLVDLHRVREEPVDGVVLRVQATEGLGQGLAAQVPVVRQEHAVLEAGIDRAAGDLPGLRVAVQAAAVVDGHAVFLGDGGHRGGKGRLVAHVHADVRRAAQDLDAAVDLRAALEEGLIVVDVCGGAQVVAEAVGPGDEQAAHARRVRDGAAPEVRVPADAEPGVVAQALQRVHRARRVEHDVRGGAKAAVVRLEGADVADVCVAHVVGADDELLHVKSSLAKKSYGTSISENPDGCKRFLPGGGVDLRAARAYNGGEFFCTARRREDDQLSL